MEDEPSPTPAPTSAADPGRARALLTVWFTLFLDLVAFGLIIPVLPFYAEHFGAAVWQVTLLSTVFSLAQFVMSPILGRLSDRYGRRRIMLLSIAGSSLSMLLLGLAGALWMVFAARLVNGACNANISTAHAYVADRTAPSERAKYMGMMGAAIGIGFVVGPIIGGLLALESMPELPFLVAAALGVLNFLMALVWLPESRARSATAAAATAAPARAARPARRFLALLDSDLRGTQIGALALIAFGFFTAFANMESSFALFTEATYSWGARETGFFFTYVGVVIALTQGALVGRVVDGLGERRTLLLGMALMAAGLLAQGALHWMAALLVGGALIAGGNGLMNPSLNALVSRASSEDDQGLNMGIVQSASSLGRITGPAIAGPLFELITPGAPLLFAGFLVLVVLGLAARKIEAPAPA
ncbi:MAG: MFS transporter [Myxococcales bacterium]|nr:MFS transporter [Myxococcales bacterium]